MRQIFLMLLLLLLMPALSSCDRSEQDSGYHGYLYFAKGAYLMRFALRDASLSVVTNLGDKTIQDLSKFVENKLLIAETASVNRRKVYRISWIDVKTGQTSALYAGVFARYLAESGQIVYDDGDRLFAVAIFGDSSSETIFSHRMNQLSKVMVGPVGTVLFETSDAGVRHIHSYDLMTGTLETLDRLSEVCRLEHAVWIDDLDQMACKEQSSPVDQGHYVLANLDGDVSGELNLPEGKQFNALAYIADQSALILTERWSSLLGGRANSAVWIHNIQSGENRRLAKNQNLGSSVVYTDF
jgi:hypothetical protein